MKFDAIRRHVDAGVPTRARPSRPNPAIVQRVFVHAFERASVDDHVLAVTITDVDAHRAVANLTVGEGAVVGFGGGRFRLYREWR